MNSTSSRGKATATMMPMMTSDGRADQHRLAHADAVDDAAGAHRENHRQERKQGQDDADGKRRRLQVQREQRQIDAAPCKREMQQERRHYNKINYQLACRRRRAKRRFYLRSPRQTRLSPRIASRRTGFAARRAAHRAALRYTHARSMPSRAAGARLRSLRKVDYGSQKNCRCTRRGDSRHRFGARTCCRDGERNPPRVARALRNFFP